MPITLPHNNLHGFTLVEMAIVLVIIGLSLGMLLPMTTGLLDSQKRQLVQTKLSVIDTALVNFVAQNKRLPCPALGTTASGAVGAGIENVALGACAPATEISGVVPWVTLGISENDASDPWNGRITYRVDPVLAQFAPAVPSLLMDMSNCDPAGTGAAGGSGAVACQNPTPPCTANPATCTSPMNFLIVGTGKGLDVWNGVGGGAGWATRTNNRGTGTGAAYVLISHGPSGTGAYNSGGVLQPGNIAAGADEIPNQNGQAVAIPSAQGSTYREGQLNDVQTALHFDDYLSHPTIMAVLQKANLGPRAH